VASQEGLSSVELVRKDGVKNSLYFCMLYNGMKVNDKTNEVTGGVINILTTGI
jgi:hypothetical protein